MTTKGRQMRTLVSGDEGGRLWLAYKYEFKIYGLHTFELYGR